MIEAVTKDGATIPLSAMTLSESRAYKAISQHQPVDFDKLMLFVNWDRRTLLNILDSLERRGVLSESKDHLLSVFQPQGNKEMATKKGKVSLTTVEELEAAPMAVLIDFYNSHNPNEPVKRFTNKATAVERCTEFLGAEKPKKSASKAKAPKAPKGEGSVLPKTPVSVAERAARISATWEDPEVREARKQRNGVKVDGVQYKSVREAFAALDLPLSVHVPFRGKLKAAGKLEFHGHKFVITDPVAPEPKAKAAK